ncbi:uncharacterized protein E0L32_011954 [Thyridium curvatum]|uniref:3-phytase n=1 Tax=Thyridium curvatum TaxID=1093900 RepID=A0A507BEQ3_9PEZI|nr:uncharacterized protein E0L32_011954 [Thyridium curvatum]TPX17953.1 hypothetical protein E0L32_011954 [Thyridium curvatum]
MTTLQPRKPYTDEELRQLYPAGLELQLVQILLRHGERTPVSARFQNAGLHAFWPYCSAVRQLKSAVLEREHGAHHTPFSTLEWKRRLEAFGPDDAPIVATGPDGELDAVCDMGMLTDTGRITTFQLGTRLRNLYVDRLKFIPSTIKSTDFMYLRATPIPRALDSLQQTLAGLYPAQTRVGSENGTFPAPTILARAPQDETLFPNDQHCRRFAELSRAFAQRTADRWNTTDDMEYLNKIYGKWMSPENPRVAVDGRPRLSGIMDTINSTAAHGPETKLPKQFYDEKAHRIMEKIGVEEWYSGYKESREYRMLGIGGLMGDIVARMVGSVEQSTAAGEYELMRKSAERYTPIKFGLSGCHDTTLAGVLSSLGAFETEKWPPFTSHIAIELFRRSNSPATVEQSADPVVQSAVASDKSSWFGSWFSSRSAAGKPPPGIGRTPSDKLSPADKKKLDGYYVRIRYNDEPVTIPGCKAAGKHLEGDESFCTLEEFKAIVDKYTPQDWKQQCRMNIKSAAFPEKPEPAGY